MLLCSPLSNQKLFTLTVSKRPEESKIPERKWIAANIIHIGTQTSQIPFWLHFASSWMGFFFAVSMIFVTWSNLTLCHIRSHDDGLYAEVRLRKFFWKSTKVLWYLLCIKSQLNTRKLVSNTMYETMMANIFSCIHLIIHAFYALVCTNGALFKAGMPLITE